MTRVTVVFEIDTDSEVTARLRVNGIFASLSIPDDTKITIITSEDVSAKEKTEK